MKKGHLGRSRSTEHGPFATADAPFKIPQTWEWVHATEPAVLISNNGKKVQTKDALESGRFPVVDQGKVFIRGYCNDADKVISVVEPIIVFGDHTRETKLIDFDFVVGADGVKLLKPIHIDPAYYYLALQWVPLDSRGYGRHFKLLRASSIPLPPLAEQHRIVMKVDELIKLCDELAAAQVKREKRRDRLVAATLHGLNNGDSDSDASEQLPFKDSARFYFNHLPRLTTRPEHIQQLRQIILNLAVRGKLVPQDPKDEPAVKLLNKIEKEREQLLAKRMRKSAPSLPVENIEILFEVPANWHWVRLLDLCHVITDGEHLTPQYTDEGIPILSAKHIGQDSLIFDDLKFVSQKTAERCWIRCFPEERDILVVSRGGGVGRTIVSGYRDYCLMGSVLLFKPSAYVHERFLCLFLNSPLGNMRLRMTSDATAQQAIYIAHLKRDYVVPLPPLAEQHRIVAKVNELMTLCDETETRIATKMTTNRKLFEATLQETIAEEYSYPEGGNL